MLEPAILGLLALKNLRAIIDMEKEELFVKKPVEEPESFESVLKTLSVFMNRGRVVEPWTEITVQGRVAGSLNDYMEGWLVESNCFSKNQSGCLLVARAIANVYDGMIPIRVANYSSQTVLLRKQKLLAYAEEVDNITMSDKETPEQVEVVWNISNTIESSEQLPDHLQLRQYGVKTYLQKAQKILVERH